MQHLEGILQRKGIEYVVILLSEIFPAKLSLFEDVDAYVSSHPSALIKNTSCSL